MEAFEGLRFLASFGPPGTGKNKGGKKTQPFNRFQSHPGIMPSMSNSPDPNFTSHVHSISLKKSLQRVQWPYFRYPMEVQLQQFLLEIQSRRSCTACGHRIAHRKWKETKQQPGTAGPGGPGNMLGCCFVSFHFLWAIICLFKDPSLSPTNLRSRMIII